MESCRSPRSVTRGTLLSVPRHADETSTISLTWIGHATNLIEYGGHRVLTDPIVTQRVAHLRRRRPVPRIDPVDTVLVSHVHMDHLHVPSLRLVAAEAEVVVPSGARPLVARLGSAGVREVVVGDRFDMAGGISVEVVHAEHLAGRGPHSRIRAEPVGYVVRAGGVAIYFAGDTDLFPQMSELGVIDIALIPIWGWGPTLGEKHLTPVSAAEATMRIAPRRVIPIHWGTYTPIRARRGSPPWLENPIAEFREQLGHAGLEDRLHVLYPGDSTEIVPA